MSLAEIKIGVANLTADERLEVAALIAHLHQADNPEHQLEMEHRMNAMDVGKKVSQTDLERLHDRLKSESR